MEKEQNSNLNVFRYLRRMRGLSMQKVADDLGICLLTEHSLEHGALPRLGLLQRISNYYRVSLDALAHNDIAAAASQAFASTPCASKEKRFFREKQAHCDALGDRGEQIVVEAEKLRLEATPFSEAVSGSASEDANAGFDVLSFEEDGTPIYIEVKTTSYSEIAPFYMSRKELAFLKRCLQDGQAYQLHRVYDLDDEDRYKVRVLSAEELLRDYEFVPSTFLVRRKKV